MLAATTPLTKMIVHIHYLQDKVSAGHDMLEGEVPMSAQQQDWYKSIIGDGKASVTASKELSESDYGNGGKVFVSVTLTVDQSQGCIDAGITGAKALADSKAWEAHAEMKQQLHQRGILR